MSVLTEGDILSKLNNVHKRGNGLVAECPVCHDDHHLYINREGDKLLLYCQKCKAKYPEIIKALDVQPAVQQPKLPRKPKDHGKQIEEIRYTYRAPSGKPEYQKVRRKFEDGHKVFSFCFTNENGQVQYKKPEGCDNLYNLDRLAAADPSTILYIVEGEKCADAMTSKGFLATSTNTGSQKHLKLSDVDRQMLDKFKRKVIIPDHDDPGMDYAHAWENLGAKIFPWEEIWPTIQKKQDVADYFQQGGDPERIRNWKYPAADFTEEYFSGLDRAEMIKPALFAGINAISDPMERQQAESLASFRAKELGITREYQKNYKAWRAAQAQANKGSKNTTKFSNQPVVLECGDWIADDDGVRKMEASGNGEFRYAWASPIPILPTEILMNQETATEKIRLSYYKPDGWRSCVVPREIAANSSKIVALANMGVEVNSDNAKNLVKYLAGCVALNPVNLPRVKSVGHCGWVGGEFVPYTDEISLDSTDEYGTLIDSITEKGTLGEWLAAVKPLLGNLYLRLAIAASLAAPLIKPLGALSFVFHLWGGTGAGKTVGLMVAASVWGNPAPGKLVQSMNNTVNFTTGCAATLGNLPFFGDELQTIKSKFDDYDQFIHQITAEVSRGRMDQTGRIQLQKSWKTAFLFTGEEPISQTTSGGGVENRLIEIECVDKVVENGPETVQAITNQYGTLGPAYIAKLQEKVADGIDLREVFNDYHRKLLQAETTEKQAMAMGIMMTADEFFRMYFAPELPPLTISQVQPFLKTTREVDTAERAYNLVIDLIAQNNENFFYSIKNNYNDEQYHHAPVREVWGKIDGNHVWIIKRVLEKLLSDNGLSFRAVSKKWATTGRLIPTKQGKFASKLSMSGIFGYYVELVR